MTLVLCKIIIVILHQGHDRSAESANILEFRRVLFVMEWTDVVGVLVSGGWYLEIPAIYEPETSPIGTPYFATPRKSGSFVSRYKV